MGLLMVRLRPTPFGLRLALAGARATCASPPDSLVEPTWALTSIKPPERKKPARGGLFCLGWLMGFEPTTTGITIQDSTAELQPP